MEAQYIDAPNQFYAFITHVPCHQTSRFSISMVGERMSYPSVPRDLDGEINI